MNFNSRQTYLTAVAEWKAHYKILSANIRQANVNFKEAQRVAAYASGNEWREANGLSLITVARLLIFDGRHARSLKSLQPGRSRRTVNGWRPG